MKPKRCVAEHFGSYEHAEIEFSDLGLTLISGKTGAGKSTIGDMIAWACFGITSKNGLVDEVRTWGSDEPTKVVLDLELSDELITITRVHGKRSHCDLYWVEQKNPEKVERGKDIPDTQKRLSERLGVNDELYLLASYFSQFSDVDRFFVSKPRDRREVLEKITDLSLPVKLAEVASEARKLAKKELEALESALTKESGRQEQLLSQEASIEKSSQAWETQNAKQIADAEKKYAEFDGEKVKKVDALVQQINETESLITPDEEFEKKIAKIKAEQEKLAGFRFRHQVLLQKLSGLNTEILLKKREMERQKKLPDTCPECKRGGLAVGREKHLKLHQEEIAALETAQLTVKKDFEALGEALAGEQSLTREFQTVQKAQSDNERLKDRLESECQALVTLDESVNPHEDRVKQLKQTKNPYSGQLEACKKAIDASKTALEKLEKESAEKTYRVTSLSSIYDLSFSLRGELLQNAVSQLERETNRRLETYFDGAFRVKFILESSDKLEVKIYKDEFLASFRQLSGGQRRMLVIAFSTALMQLAADTAGVHFDLMVFDEVFDGLDTDLKIQAFRLFEELSNDVGTILFIDHDERLKSCFRNVISVSIDEGGKSMIESEREGSTEEAA